MRPVPAADLIADACGGAQPGAGWWVLSYRDLAWRGIPGHAYTALDTRGRWTRYGCAVDVLAPGMPNGMYHREHHADESFLVLAGAVDAVVEGEALTLTAGDLLHTPRGTAHIMAGAGDRPAMVFMLGARGRDPEGAEWGEYVPDAVAGALGASVAERTPDATVAYAHRPDYAPVECPVEWNVGEGASPTGGARGPGGFEATPAGLHRTGEGWFAVNLDDMAWSDNGRVCRVRADGDVSFTQYGFNVRLARPGWPSSRYHYENLCDETFVVLDGEGVAVIEGSEIPVTGGDIVHLPAGTAHTVVGAGERGVVVLMTGDRDGPPGTVPGWGGYVADAVAERYGASVAATTEDPGVAYADDPPFSPSRPAWTFSGGWTP